MAAPRTGGATCSVATSESSAASRNSTATVAPGVSPVSSSWPAVTPAATCCPATRTVAPAGSAPVSQAMVVPSAPWAATAGAAAATSAMGSHAGSMSNMYQTISVLWISQIWFRSGRATAMYRNCELDVPTWLCRTTAGFAGSL